MDSSAKSEKKNANYDSITVYLPKRHSDYMITSLKELAMSKHGHSGSLSRVIRQVIYEELIRNKLMDRQGRHLTANLKDLREKNKEKIKSDIF